MVVGFDSRYFNNVETIKEMSDEDLSKTTMELKKTLQTESLATMGSVEIHILYVTCEHEIWRRSTDFTSQETNDDDEPVVKAESTE